MKNLTKNVVITSVSILALIALISTPAFAAGTLSTSLGSTSPVSEGSTAPVLTSVCGDANNDGTPNLTDYSTVNNYVFKGGPAPINMPQSDINRDTKIDILDVQLLYQYLFQGGTCPKLATSTVPLTSVCGDANNDGRPDILDHGVLSNYLGGLGPKPVNAAQADIDRNGSLTKDDLTLLDNYIWRGGTCPATMPVYVAPTLTSVCGDANNDGTPNIIDHMILEQHVFKSGPKPINAVQADINKDSVLDVIDVISLFNYLYQGGSCPVVASQPVSDYDGVSCVDYNKDGMIDQLDIEKVADAAFRGAPYDKDCDWDKNGYIDIVDVVRMVDFVNRDGLLPVCKEKEHVSCFDIDNDHDTDFNDMYLLIGIAHQGQPMPKDADNKDNYSIVDVHMDGVIDILDVVDAVNYLYRDGAKPECIPPQEMPYLPPKGDPTNGT